MNMKSYISRFLTVFLLMGLAVLPVAGCAVALLGVGGATGYAISRDEIEGIMDTKYEQVWKASSNALARRGTIKTQSETQGKIDAEIEGSVVNLSIDKPTPKTTRLRVKARRGLQLFPNIKLAQSIYNEIIKAIE